MPIFCVALVLCEITVEAYPLQSISAESLILQLASSPESAEPIENLHPREAGGANGWVMGANRTTFFFSLNVILPQWTKDSDTEPWGITWGTSKHTLIVKHLQSSIFFKTIFQMTQTVCISQVHARRLMLSTGRRVKCYKNGCMFCLNWTWSLSPCLLHYLSRLRVCGSSAHFSLLPSNSEINNWWRQMWIEYKNRNPGGRF